MVTPKNQEKIFDPKYSEELLRISLGDLATAQTLCDAFKQGKPLRVENIFYLAHQAIEKALKGYLVWSKKPVPFVHELGSLVAKIAIETEELPFGYEISQLDSFASMRRYEEGHVTLSVEEAEMVVKLAETCVSWVRQNVPV